MNKRMLQDVFREYKKATTTAGCKLDYAITNPDGLGDCPSCVNYNLCEKYGEESKGVWAKHWTRGMNASGDMDRTDYVYIAHDLDDAQVALFYQVVGEHYNILPKKEDFDPSRCFVLYETDTPVYAVTYKEMWRGREWNRSYEFTDDAKALSYLNDVFINAVYRDEGNEVTDVAMKRLF